MTAEAESDLMQKIVSLCKRRGFVFPSSEIYGGLRSAYDYGPMGVELKRNLMSEWWTAMVYKREDIVGIDASIIMHPEVWRSSGHLANFSDPLVDCLDGADASQLTPKRNESVTAPQALALLNNEFVLVHSKAFAEWLVKQSADRGRQIGTACERVWGRPPSDDERKALAAYAGKHGLANLCRVLFNSNEFLFVD